MNLWSPIACFALLVNSMDLFRELPILTITIRFHMLQGLVVSTSRNVKYLTHHLNGIVLFLFMNQIDELVVRYFLANMAIAFFKISISCFMRRFSF